ncbi:MAG: geranylgeranylglycerol-phosphate geranylgeranyltransferase [Bacteroidia bacterium]|nr:geranylgeranylglycerol-phosphate geranylgeranyltransferase [Bacteroidia bacterium]
MSIKTDIIHFYNISRPLNLAIAFVSFCLGAFIANKHSFVFLNHTVFWAVGTGLVLIAAGGYWINDVYDFRIDRINKPERTIINAHLSVKKVVTVYIIMYILLFVLLVITVKKLAFIMMIAAFLLFIYAAWLKRTTLLGNVTVAFLTALVLMMAGFIYTFNSPVVWLAVFAFEVNLIREIVKDIEDIEGDMYFNLQTLPIQIGIKHTRILVYVLYNVLLISCWLPLIQQILTGNPYSVIYIVVSFFIVQVPVIGLQLHFTQCKNKEDYGRHSLFVKILMLTGMISIILL